MEQQPVKGLALLLVLVSGLAVALIRMDQPTAAKEAPTPAIPTVAQLERFQSVADNACLCERRAGGDRNAACWSEYDRAVARYKPDRMATTCAFENNESDYFAPFDQHGFSENAVTIRHPPFACTWEEEQARAKAKDSEAVGCG
jgi:hypothetical protein